MPKIPTYEARETQLARLPTFSAEEFGAAKGRALADLGSSITGLGRAITGFQERREISKLTAAMATAHAETANAQREWQKTVDPDDEEAVQKFQDEQVNKRMDLIGADVKTAAGRRYYERASAEFRANFSESATAIYSQATETQAIAEYEQTRNARSAALVTDPSSFEAIMADIDASTDAMVAAGISRETAIKQQTQDKRNAAMAAALGWSRLDPDYAEQLQQSGYFNKYLDGQDQVQFAGAIDIERRARRADIANARALERQRLDDLDDAAQYEWNDKVVAGDATALDIVRDDRLKPETQRTLINVIEANATAPVIRSDPATYQDLLSRAALPPDDPNRASSQEVLRAMQQRRLKPEDANDIYAVVSGKANPDEQLANQQFDDFTKAMKGSITRSNPLLNAIDAEGDQRYFDFTREAKKAFDAGRKRGLTVDQLLSPSSPNYLGQLATNYVLNKKQFKATMDKYLQGGVVFRGGEEGAPKKSLDDIFGGK